MRKDRIWKLENGEIIDQNIHCNLVKKYKADTPFDNKVVPYLIMAFCALVDGFVFYGLFSKISYDSPVMLGVQIAGFLFGFDVVPIFFGIQYRRLRQGLNKDRFTLILALAVCSIACLMNIILRITTIDLLSPDVGMETTSYFGTAVQEAETDVDPTAIALTIFGIGIPLVTSLGSFVIAYMTYDPLKIRMRREEEMIEATRDEVRRLEAILDDYDAEPNFAEHLMADEEGKFREMIKLQQSLAIGYCDYVRQKLKEHLHNPSSNSVLSRETCEDILKRMEREIACLEASAERGVCEEEKNITPIDDVRRLTV